MEINVQDPLQQTLIISIALIIALIISARKDSSQRFFDTSITNELKGFSILAIMFAHIGYYLSTNTAFLFPLSILAGVGVNIFLFLSGFGLTISNLKNQLSPAEFYRKRLKRIFLPFWLILVIFLLADKVILNLNYDFSTIWHSLVGFFPRADLYQDLDSPLWYFSMILFYYLIFPWVFLKKFSYLSPVLILVLSWGILKLNLPINQGVFNLIKTHTVAFPLGMLFALSLQGKFSDLVNALSQRLTRQISKVKFLNSAVRIILLLLFGYLICYTAIHSGVGQGTTEEQITSLFTTVCLVYFFVLKKIKLEFLNLVGLYSYEIYLIHWPILYRFDVFYKKLPAFLATLLYIVLFIVLGFLLQYLVDKILKIKRLPAVLNAL